MKMPYFGRALLDQGTNFYQCADAFRPVFSGVEEAKLRQQH